MKKYVFSVMCAVILAVTAMGICASAEEESTRVPAQKMSQEADTVTAVKSKKVTAKATTTQSKAKDSKATEASEKETPETVANGREGEDDPFANADGWEIPTSFYIGGGVIGAFIIASVIVLIMGKPKEK